MKAEEAIMRDREYLEAIQKKGWKKLLPQWNNWHW